MVHQDIRLTYVLAPNTHAKSRADARSKVFDVLRGLWPGKVLQLDIITFQKAVSRLRQLATAPQYSQGIFGDLLVAEAITSESYDPNRLYHATVIEAHSPLELAYGAYVLNPTLGVLICNLSDQAHPLSPFPTFSADDPLLARTVASTYHRVRMGLSAHPPSHPYVTLDRVQTFGASFLEPSIDIPTLLSTEFPDASVQADFASAYGSVFGDIREAPQAAVVAHVCRYLASLTIEGRNFRTGMILLIPAALERKLSDLRERLGKRRSSQRRRRSSSADIPEYIHDLQELSLIHLKDPFPIDMRYRDQVVRVTEGIDGIGSTLVIDRSSLVAFAVALSHLPQSTLDIDDFFTITKVLEGLGFFVPGDKTVHIGREPLDPMSLQFTNDQWRLGGLAAPFILALLEQAEAVGVKNLRVPARLHQLVRLLSRQHLGSFIVLGNTEKLNALKIKGVHMRPTLSSTFEGQSILKLSDATFLQILGLDGAHFVTLDGKIQAIGMHVLLSDTPAGQSLPGTKRSTALGITQLHEDIVAITVSQDGPTRLWRRGCEISSIG
jgi:hypothetical protein